MKSSWIAVSAVLILAGCAGMPNVPGGIPIPGLPGGLSITTDQVTQVASAVQAGTKEYTEPEEVELGEGIAESMLGAAPLLPNPGVQRYVNQVGRWLALQTNRADLPWRFGVLDNENVNAFAVPGGAIFITNGLLKKLQNEAELAGVLAHEIAHVVQRHQIKAIQSGGWTDLGKTVGQIGLDSKLSRMGAGGQVARAMGGAEVGAKLLVDGLFTRPLDRGLEYEADRMGVIIAARAGYDPFAFISVLQTLEAQAKDDPLLALIYKTHPQPSDRITELERIASTLDRYAGGDQGRERFVAALGLRATTAPAAAPAQRQAAPARAPAKAPPAKPPAVKTAPGK